MTTSVQSASSHPTARDLLNILLYRLDDEDLDKHIGFDDEDGYVPWLGRLEIDEENGAIWLSYEPSDVIYAQQVADRKAAEAERLAYEAQLPERVDHDEKVRAARDAGLLPPGA